MSSSRASSRRGSRNSDELSLASTCDDQASRLNLPLDKEFLPLSSPTQDEAEQAQQQVRDQVICMIFDLPESTQFYEGALASPKVNEGCRAAVRAAVAAAAAAAVGHPGGSWCGQAC
ncbi:unnamed protein product [Phytophthora fragariaefolia]|uniref:Unnamed protein product n=1 Tax=Phytophthora fragariaefolia TaxID=1490495 RepID=A0A9W6Y0L9_9STRA|nr:unnamed protein product [Phytophthora fragariaefolia]